MNNIENIVQIFHKSYQIDRVVFNEPVPNSFIKEQLIKNALSGPAGQYWASINSGSLESRFKIKDSELVVYMVFDHELKKEFLTEKYLVTVL